MRNESYAMERSMGWHWSKIMSLCYNGAVIPADYDAYDVPPLTPRLSRGNHLVLQFARAVVSSYQISLDQLRGHGVQFCRFPSNSS